VFTITRIDHAHTTETNEDIKHICPGDIDVICLKFKYFPEIIEPNENFFLREGLCLGVGTILEPID